MESELRHKYRRNRTRENSAPQDIAIVEPQTTASGGVANGDAALPEADPRHCVLLRAGGLLSVLDMDQVW